MRSKSGNEASYEINKSRKISVFIVTAFLFHMSLDLTVGKFVSGPKAVQLKIFLSNLIFFITLPGLVIYNNPKLLEHSLKVVNPLFEIRILKWIPRFCFENKVMPQSIIDRSVVSIANVAMNKSEATRISTD